VQIVEVPASEVALEDAIKSYLFNASSSTLPEGGMALILPEEARETPSVWKWLQEMIAGNGPIRKLFIVGRSSVDGEWRRPAVPSPPSRRLIPQRWTSASWLTSRSSTASPPSSEPTGPSRIAPEDLLDPKLWERMERGRAALLKALELGELV
jgi:succinylarginine dihydrolase